MLDPQPYNVAIIEFEVDNGLHTVTASAETANEDAIAIACDALQEINIDGVNVQRVYSERRPSPEVEQFIVDTFPNALLTWSFDYGEDAEMVDAIERLHKKPWWRFW